MYFVEQQTSAKFGLQTFCGAILTKAVRSLDGGLRVSPGWKRSIQAVHGHHHNYEWVTILIVTNAMITIGN